MPLGIECRFQNGHGSRLPDDVIETIYNWF